MDVQYTLSVNISSPQLFRLASGRLLSLTPSLRLGTRLCWEFVLNPPTILECSKLEKEHHLFKSKNIICKWFICLRVKRVIGCGKISCHAPGFASISARSGCIQCHETAMEPWSNDIDDQLVAIHMSDKHVHQVSLPLPWPPSNKKEESEESSSNWLHSWLQTS